jgi:putative transposon-encoded protein
MPSMCRGYGGIVMGKGNISFEIEDVFVKEVVKSGNGALVWIPKKYMGKNAVILITKKPIKAELLK